MKKRFKYSFARKKDTEEGVVSVIYAGISLGLFVISAIVSFSLEGNAGSWIGALGLMGILFSGVGFRTGLQSFHEKERNYRLSAVGAMANGLFLVGWLAIFLIGIS